AARCLPRALSRLRRLERESAWGGGIASLAHGVALAHADRGHRCLGSIPRAELAKGRRHPFFHVVSPRPRQLVWGGILRISCPLGCVLRRGAVADVEAQRTGRKGRRSRSFSLSRCGAAGRLFVWPAAVLAVR